MDKLFYQSCQDDQKKEFGITANLSLHHWNHVFHKYQYRIVALPSTTWQLQGFIQFRNLLASKIMSSDKSMMTYRRGNTLLVVWRVYGLKKDSKET